jgi:N-dimethylarginine dimethylaminohydrolase
MKFTEPKARFLMCRPEHFAVSYAINPWMDPNSWARDRRAHAAAARQWEALHGKLIEHGAAVEFVPPVAGLPDLVFTANGAVVLDREVLLARFRHPERQREEAHFEKTFRALQAHGLVDGIRRLPDNLVLEGAGDCVWDGKRKSFWMGYGPRSDFEARHAVADLFGHDVLALELADPRFYHMDTALAPLPHGEVMYLPGAFTAAGNAAIRDRVVSHDRVAIAFEDARRFAANTVCLGDTLIMSGCGARLRAELTERGYQVVTTPLTSFVRSGGAAFCLTLRLDRESLPRSAALDQAAVA